MFTIVLSTSTEQKNTISGTLIISLLLLSVPKSPRANDFYILREHDGSLHINLQLLNKS